MSVRTSAGLVVFTLYNINRESANPPVVFPDIKDTVPFSYCIWVKVANNIPANVLGFFCADGSHTVIGHDGDRWFLSSRNSTVGQPTQYFNPVTVNRWAFIGIIKLGANFHIYYGLQDPTETSPWTHEVAIQEVVISSTIISSEFNGFQIYVYSNTSVACFKFWNYALSISALQTEGNRWDAGTAFWASTLRTPGDLSNIANPYADRNWDHGHAFSVIDPRANLVYDNDPAYMANATPCPTWVYPNVFTSVFVDPGTTPVVTTVYKGTQFFDFADAGSVTPADHQIQSIYYYGSAFGGIDPGAPFNECWGLYKDENGVEVATMGDPVYRFVPGDTLVVIPPSPTGVIKASTMYAWKFGGQFIWNPVTPQGPTNTAHLAYMLLLVTYIGYPTGVPQLPVNDLAGLFAINKDGPSVDQYNRGTKLKIPDPTIKTAYIGE